MTDSYPQSYRGVERCRRYLVLLLVSLCIGSTSGCNPIGPVVNKFTASLSRDFASAVLKSEDPQVVEDALPAYLILIDSFIEGGSNDVGLLLSAATLNGSYASAFVEDEERRRYLAKKALNLAVQAGCRHSSLLCDVQTVDFPELTDRMAVFGAEDVEVLYTLSSTWAGWIQANTENWLAIAQLARVKLLMQRVLELDEGYSFGAPHMYIGVFETLIPPAMGGRPEVGRMHFERAIALSEERNLYAKVLFAENYARMVFEQELHDQLLNEVLQADAVAGELTLQNRIAQQQAKELLLSGKDYF